MEKQEYFDRVDEAYESLDGAALEQRLLELTEQAGAEYGKQGAFYASMLSELGGFYRGQGRFEESERYFREALTLLESACGKNSPDYATGLNNLAGTLRRMEKYDEAEILFAEALSIYENTVGETHILYASGLNNLSLVSLDRGNELQAAAYLYRAAEILKELPECRDELAAALCNLGSLHRRLGKTELAERELTEAVGMFENELGTRTPHYHASLFALGLTRLNACDVPGAKDALRKARTAAAALYGPDHRETQVIDGYLRRVEEMK